jgi:hypothetical protein
MVSAIARGVAALALVALAESAASCDSSALAKCTSQHGRPSLAKGAHSVAVATFCKSASTFYECVAESGCLSGSVAKECASDFDDANCDGASVCKPAKEAAKGGKEEPAKEEPAAPPGCVYYVMLLWCPFYTHHQRRKKLGVVASCDICSMGGANHE